MNSHLHSHTCVTMVRIVGEVARTTSSNVEEWTVSTNALNIPAVKIFFSFPREVLECIGTFSQHTHIYRRDIPPGPRDNNEYDFVCRTCGHEYGRSS